MLDTIAKGATSIGIIETIDQVPPVNSSIEIVKLIIQFAVGLFTCLHLRKQSKKL